MAPAAALGEGLWEQHGGKVLRQTHPSGRITFIYVSPTGDKFRSWKQCLTYIESADPSGSSKDLFRLPTNLKTSIRNGGHSASPPGLRKHPSGGGKKSSHANSSTVVLESSSSEERENFRRADGRSDEKLRTTRSLHLHEAYRAAGGPSSPYSPDTTAGRRRSSLDSPAGPKGRSPSTFTGANMPGKSQPRIASPVPPSCNLLGMSPARSSETGSHVKAGKTKSSKKIKHESKVTDSAKRRLTESGRKKIEEFRRVGGILNPRVSTTAPVTETTTSQVRSIKVVLKSDEIAAPDADSGAEFETQLHSSKVDRESKKPELPAPTMQSQQPVKMTLSGRKRSHESSGDHMGSPRENEDSDYCASESDHNEDVKIHKRTSIRPKRAAAGTNFKEKTIRVDEEDGRIDVKEERFAECEDVAIVTTTQPGDGPTPQRRLVDFTIQDEDGNHRSGDYLEICELYISSLVVPMTGVLDKEKGVRCDGFGPITSWYIMGYEQNSPTLVFCTELAEYYCVKPAAVYKKVYNILHDKAKVCVEVYKTLSKPEGGDPLLSLDELIAKMSRSFSKQGDMGHFFNREFVIKNGKFVIDQLCHLDVHAEEKQQLFSGLPALASLEQEAGKQNLDFANSVPPVKPGALTIRECSSHANGDGSGGVASLPDSVHEDEKLARLLQEEDDRANNKPSRRAPTNKGKYYIKINETEIANDYPLPAYYTAEDEEMDEYLFFDEIAVEDPEDLPKRKLHDWALYNSDSRLISLELLPMLRGAETDMEIFGSGVITEDDGSGFCLDSEAAEGASVTGSNGGGEATANGNGCHEGGGIRVYLSAIKEWKIEFGASLLFISFRTDGAWYLLGKPSQQYSPWYEPVLKTAKLAVKIITMLKESLRVNRLSLNDVLKKLTDQGREEPTYLSSKQAEVERYVMAHGQIILQQFAEYPDEAIKRSAFITGLAIKMEQLSHTKLVLGKKKIFKKGRNLNPRANLCPDGHKRKPMRATSTRLVDELWSAYYAGSAEALEAAAADGVIAEIAEKDAEVVEEELVEESDDEEALEVKPSSLKDTPTKKSKRWRVPDSGVQWVDKPVSKTINNEPVYRQAISHGTEFAAGKCVLVNLYDGNDNPEPLPVILLIEYLYDTNRGGPTIHGRVLQRGMETVLGNAANERELFLTDACEDVEIEKIEEPVTVEMRERKWGHEHRKENAEKDAADKASAKQREKEDLPREYFCRSLYSPERGAFFSLPKLALGNGSCKACEARRVAEEKVEVLILPNEQGFRFQGVEYRIDDYFYLDPDTFESNASAPGQKILFKGGRNKGLRAFGVCQLLNVLPSHNGSSKRASRLMKIRRFYRPEDIDKLKAYKADIHEVYYSEETSIVDVAAARGKCVVRRQVHEVAASEKCAVNHVFFCSCIHDPKTGTVKQLPPHIKLSLGSSLESTTGKSQAEEIAAKAKGKGKAIESEPIAEIKSESALSTLDIFAGCGGLSEGLHQSGVSVTKWAIEYDHPAAEAFKLNHPTADVFCENCNVILRSIMEIGGDLDDCVSTPEADELSLKLDKEKKLRLPKPGEVDFISGGPPCQGFSGMNRFNQRAWSKVQCEMILSFLSYAEYFRPRYFLLENVRNFVSFNKGQTFRLSLASLLEMGYQVRFGVLQAGNYGVAQSRKRAFIWAAAPGEILPEWPEPKHVFSSSQLGITLPSGFQYAAVRDAARGAPLRSITVRDTVGDLPAVENGASKPDISYVNQPESWFQIQIRGGQTHLLDHISKEMNELNMLRCQRIPKEPGADWRNLPEEKVKLSTGQMVDLIPWCLPNTADRHNQWKGLFGRLDWDGNFPTSITDPQPMGKVGMCFHPEQDRIVTVRECARSQGFPDAYKFYGNINSKHRQIGNAVPPPLARALGHMLKEAIKEGSTASVR